MDTERHQADKMLLTSLSLAKKDHHDGLQQIAYQLLSQLSKLVGDEAKSDQFNEKMISLVEKQECIRKTFNKVIFE